MLKTIASTAFLIFSTITALAANSELDRFRRMALFDFAASATAVVFPVVFSPDTVGLIVLNRYNNEIRTIYQPSNIIRSPHLSADGRRLIFVRRKAGDDTNELITCVISEWRCHKLLSTTATIFSPKEIARDAILYSSSPLMTTPADNRKSAPYNNLYLLKTNSEPIKLTQFDAGALNPISVSGRTLLFSAVAGYFDKTTIPKRDPVASSNSDVFAIELIDDRPVLGKLPLEPLFVIRGYSTNASIAEDEEHVAFLNRRSVSGQTHFNLVTATRNGQLSRYIEAKQFGFSQPIFVGATIVANELLADQYEVKEYDFDGNQLRVLLPQDHSVEALKQLPRIELSISD